MSAPVSAAIFHANIRIRAFMSPNGIVPSPKSNYGSIGNNTLFIWRRSMHLSDAFRMAQHGEVYEFHLFKRKEGVCCSGWLFGGQHCVAVCSNVGLITGDRLRNAATCHAQGSLARNGRLHPTSTTALHARRVIPYCCKLMIVNFLCLAHTHTPPADDALEQHWEPLVRNCLCYRESTPQNVNCVCNFCR